MKKKIALCQSEKFKDNEVFEFISQFLNTNTIQFEKINKDTDYQALIFLTTPEDTFEYKDLILKYHQESRPLIGFNESVKTIAQILKKFNPIIALNPNDIDQLKLNHLGIDSEACLENEFITDRFTKIISSPIQLTNNKSLSELKKKGLISMCKELVEMC